MGQEKQHQPVLLMCGILAANDCLIDESMAVLRGEFGPVAMTSDIMAFDYTDYYNKEMGDNILRAYVGFECLVQPGDIVRIKRRTNAIEKTFAIDGNRKVNLDPGYITLAKLVLATTKDATHRVYLTDSIYAESTLYFRDKSFHNWQWTYPDYRDPKNILFFNELRDYYKNRLAAL